MTAPGGPDLILGGNSRIGRAMKTAWPQAQTTTRRHDAAFHVDLDQPPSLWRLPEHINRALLCVGMTDIAACRLDPERSHRINVTQTIELAKLVVQRGGQPILLSTSHVFTQQDRPPATADPPSPATIYGQHKAEAEDGIRPLGQIVRITKALDPNFELFQNWISRARNGNAITPFIDYYIAPVSIKYLVSELSCCTGEPGRIDHVSAAFKVSYAEAAKFLFEQCGLPTRLINPTTATGKIARSSLRACTHLAAIDPPSPYDAIDSVAR